MRQHYRRVTAREFELEKGCENGWHNERGRDGMLFGSELIEGEEGSILVFVMAMEQRVE
jgi:hypothetical protein